MYMCMYLPCGVQERMHSLTLNFKLHFCMYTVYLRSIFVRILLTPHLSQGGGLVTTMHILACVPNQVLHCFAWSRIWENGRLHAMHQISTVFKLHTTTKRHLELASLRHYYWFITTQVLKQILSSYLKWWGSKERHTVTNFLLCVVLWLPHPYQRWLGLEIHNGCNAIIEESSYLFSSL